MLLYARLKTSLAGFWQETRGSIMVESVLTLPLLFWMTAATYDFFEVHRYSSVREKATFTVADMISRDTSASGLTSIYLDNVLTLFNEISNDDGVNQLRVSIVTYDAETDRYGIGWSQVRGPGSLSPLEDADVANDVDRLPLVPDGQEIILIESESVYSPLFNVGLSDVTIETRVFSAIRFSPQICYEGQCPQQNTTRSSVTDN